MLRAYAAAAMAVLVLACGVSFGVQDRFGELPRGALGYIETRDVEAEIRGDFLYDTSIAHSRIPQGFRILRAAEAAKLDRALVTHLERNSHYAAYAVGTVCFVSAGGGKQVFWWARAEAQGPADPNMRGPVEWIQLASWYSTDATEVERGRILRFDPMAQFTEIEVVHAGTDWRLRLQLPNEAVTADVRTIGPREKRDQQGPAFASMPLSGEAVDHFAVFTFFGHHSRKAEGRWLAKGTGPFSSMLRGQGEGTVFNTIFQDGWQTRGGLYRFQH